MTQNISDPEFVRCQYSDGANLPARIELHRRFSTNRYDFPRWLWEQFELPGNARGMTVRYRHFSD